MKIAKPLGILLIVLGVLLFLAVIVFQYNHVLSQLSDMPHKADEYHSVMEYFWSISKGAIVIAAIAGITPVAIGIVLCKK